MLPFWPNPHNIEFMIISLIAMLELPDFGHVTLSTTQFQSHNKFLLVTSLLEIVTLSLLDICDKEEGFVTFLFSSVRRPKRPILKRFK